MLDLFKTIRQARFLLRINVFGALLILGYLIFESFILNEIREIFIFILLFVTSFFIGIFLFSIQIRLLIQNSTLKKLVIYKSLPNFVIRGKLLAEIKNLQKNKNEIDNYLIYSDLKSTFIINKIKLEFDSIGLQVDNQLIKWNSLISWEHNLIEPKFAKSYEIIRIIYVLDFVKNSDLYDLEINLKSYDGRKYEILLAFLFFNLKYGRAESILNESILQKYNRKKINLHE